MRNDVNIRIGATDKSVPVFKSAEGRMKSFAGSAKALVAGMAVGVSVAATRALISSANEAIRYGSALTDAATATNTNVEALQIFRAAARDAGAEQSKMENAMVRAHKAGVDASNGLSTYTRAFDALNINIDKYNKLPTERKLEMIAVGMKNATDQNAAYAAAMDIMGTRNAPKLMEVLQRLGSDGYDSLSESISETNRIMSETDAKKLDEAADALDRLSDNWMKFKGGVVASGFNLWEDVVKSRGDLADKTNSLFDARGGGSGSGGAGGSGSAPPPAAIPRPSVDGYDGTAQVGDESYGIRDGKFLKISEELVAEVAKSGEAQQKAVDIMKETNEQVQTALSQIKEARS